MKKLLKALRIVTSDAYEIRLCRTIMTYLEMLYLYYQSAHWQTKGSEFYADHLLFQRLYEAVREEIDNVGEKMVGVYGLGNVDFSLRLASINKLADFLNMAQNQQSFVSTSVTVETKILDLLQEVDTGSFSAGVKDLFAGIANTHEGHLYLLKQRMV